MDPVRNTVRCGCCRAGHPVLAVVSAVLLWRGHNEPGGGFIAALVAACAFALYYLSVSRIPREPAVHPSRPDRRRLILAGLTGVGGYALGEFLEPAHWYILGQHVSSALIFDLRSSAACSAWS